jgi:diguanylate cyclase (GGDEF)-like protein/PAS domain S-box-containing protein
MTKPPPPSARKSTSVSHLTGVGAISSDHDHYTLRSLIDVSCDPIFAVDADYRYTSFNASHAATMKALHGADIKLGESMLGYQSEDDRTVARTNLDRALRGESVVVQACSGDEGHSRRYFSVSHDPIHDPAGVVVGVAIQVRDLTEVKQAQRALKRSEDRLGTLFEQAPVGVFLFDREMVITQCNQCMAEMMSLPRERVVGLDLVPILDQRVKGHAQAILDGEQTAYEGPYHAALTDQELWVSVRGAPLLADDGTVEGGMVVVADRSERKDAAEKIAQLAFYDPLTGLANPTLFRDRLRQAIVAGRRTRRLIAVAAVNIDRFKAIGDSLGHDLAESFVQQLATALAGAVHDRDTLSGAGSNDFLVLLPGLRDSRDAALVAERLLAAARGPWKVGRHAFHASVSVGMALCPNDGVDAEVLLQRAEWALRQAKQAGPNICQFFNENMSAHAEERLALESELHRALDEGQLVVYYQPQVDLRSLEIIGAEALVRWVHPKRGLVLPLQFIRLAEEIGLIAALDPWVMDAACAHIGSWMAASGRRLRLAVNLSARQFGSPEVAQSVAEILKRRDFPPELLEIEITETAVLAHRETAADAVAALKDLGGTVALDDFGTGYSSLANLHGLAVQRLKIDRAFVKDLPTNADSAAIATAVITLAHSLGITALAEGIETEEQLRFLRERGSDEGQGYLFSLPLPAEEWAACVADWSWPAV